MIAPYGSLLVAVYFLLTAGNCQWTVDVQLHQFENKYNAVINSDGQFCCCDDDHTCENDLSALPSDCGDSCDTWFAVSIAPCTATTATTQSQCFVETESGRIMNSPAIGVYGYIFHFTSTAQPENLSITMFDEEGGPGGDNKIDSFTVLLTLSAANHITSYTGENNISVIVLSYQILCMNSDGCSSTSLTPESSSANTVSFSLITKTAKPTVCESRSTTPVISSLINNIDCSSCPQLLDTDNTQTVIWMAVAIFSLVLAISALSILMCILCNKKNVKRTMTLNSKFDAKAASSSQQGSNSTQDIYREIDNSLYGSESADGYPQEGAIRKINEPVYELADSAQMEGDNCYETPDP